MNVFSYIASFRPAALAAILFAAASLPGFGAELKDLQFNGVGWVQYGIIAHSNDTVNNDYNGNSMQSAGAQIMVRNQSSENLEVSAGLGVLEGHKPAGTITGGGRVPLTVSPYIALANFTYSWKNEEDSKLSLTGGLFSYNYNPDVQNLGLYLLRGPVYPGIVISGFETKHVLPIANTLGIRLMHQAGNFEHNLIVNSETEMYPYFDLSPAYLAFYKFGKAFKIGAGVNFYRLIPIEDKITTPFSPERETPANRVSHPYDRYYTYVDSSLVSASPTPVYSYDTTFLSFKGTKVMANASLDPKAIFGWEDGSLGPEDLKLYSEIALIGLNNSAAYRKLYGNLSQRMPVMVGFNLPMFGLLDHLAIEVEHYGAPYRDDLTRYISGSLAKPASPIPVSNAYWLRDQSIIDQDPDADLQKKQSKDDFKWSIHGAKVLQEHFKISFQVANDHFRPGSVSGKSDQSGEAALTTSKDWYWMGKIAYFF